MLCLQLYLHTSLPGSLFLSGERYGTIVKSLVSFDPATSKSKTIADTGFCIDPRWLAIGDGALIFMCQTGTPSGISTVVYRLPAR